MRKTVDVNRELAAHLDAAYALAERHVEALARDIMRRHPNVTAYIMAMGVATFEVRGERESVGLDDRTYFKPLADFIDQWDDRLGVTGCSMWITGPDGPLVDNW